MLPATIDSEREAARVFFANVQHFDDFKIILLPIARKTNYETEEPLGDLS